MGEPSRLIQSLNSARDIVLRDAALYPQVVPGVLPVVAPTQALELRRWGADFLAETFASPVLDADKKQQLCPGALDTLKGYLGRKEQTGEEEDAHVVQSAVQCATSIYPLVFRHTIHQQEGAEKHDSDTWAKMVGIKSSILRRMDSAPGGVRICCIKFVARVVQVQTPGLISDPRRPSQNEISLALVPRDHHILTPSNLEAEASGLLDRLLGLLLDCAEDALVVTATMNCLSALVHRRASVSTKILAALLNFNPLQLSGRPMSGRDKVAVRSMTRTMMSFFHNVLKRNSNQSLAGRMQQHIDRLKHGLQEAFSDHNQLKRPAPDEPIDGLDDSKRQRLDTEVAAGTAAQQQPLQQIYPPLPSGPVTYADLFTLSRDPRAVGFHAEAIPVQFVAQLIPALLSSIDQNTLNQALGVAAARFAEVSNRPTASVQGGAANYEDDDDDAYTPPGDFGDDADERQSLQGGGESVELGPFYLPPSPPLTERETAEYSSQALDRVFETLTDFDKTNRKSKSVDGEHGFNRVASAGQGRDGWITLLTRLATRPTFDLSVDAEDVKSEEESGTVARKGRSSDVPTKVREAFHKYITDDHRHRIDVAISWLNEEWYSDKLLAKQHPRSAYLAGLPNYRSGLAGLLDSMALFLDKQDLKILVRFLHEIPLLPDQVFDWLARLADDPDRVQIVLGSLQYLIMFRPPVRVQALDCAAKMWRANADAKKGCEKLLKTWRPDVLEEGEGDAGAKKEEP